MKWFELIRHKYGCETVMLHVPYQGEGHIAPNMREYVVRQLKDTVIPTLERISGVKFDIDRLRQYMKESVKAEAWDESSPYSTSENTRQAMNRALEAYGWPPLRAEHQKELITMSDRIRGRITDEWQDGPYRALRLNALLQLIGSSPDMQLS